MHANNDSNNEEELSKIDDNENSSNQQQTKHQNYQKRILQEPAEKEPTFDESTKEGLQKKKQYLINKIVALKKKIKYKELQKKAIEEALKNEKGMDLRELKRKLKALEFKISTQAHTPQHERQFIKHMETLEKSYEDAKRIDKMKHKISLIKKDIESYNDEILRIDLLLKDIRNRISNFEQNERLAYIQVQTPVRKYRNNSKKSNKEATQDDDNRDNRYTKTKYNYSDVINEKIVVNSGPIEQEFTLGDLAVFEEDKDKKKKKK